MNNTEIHELNVPYAVCEFLVAIFAVVGNALVIFVFRKERRLRRRTNYYIVSLAAADLLVGLLGIPFALLSSVGMPSNLHACLFIVSLLVVLCTISIFSLVAVSVDRYWAILHPMGYSRNVRTKTALIIISICWFAGFLVGFLPLMGFHNHPKNDSCHFLDVMHPYYLVFLYIGTIIIPAVVLAAFYAHIYQVVVKQLRQIVTMNPERGSSSKNSSGGTMIRMLGVQQTNEVKATQNLAIIVLFFMICWIPLYTINFFLVLIPNFKVNEYVMLSCIILSHLNSAGNPILYAYHLRDFRAALKNFFCNLVNKQQYCESIYKNNVYNSTKYKVRRLPSTRSTNVKNRSRVKLVLPDKISTVVKTSAAVVAATTGETKDIWNISDNSISSSESAKSVESCNYEKTLMIRPATPYRPRNLSEINPGYLTNLCEDDESDDGFNEEELLPYHDYTFHDCKPETCFGCNKQISKTLPSEKSISISSPQLCRGLYFVESDITRGNNKTASCNLSEPKQRVFSSFSADCTSNTVSFRISPLKVVHNMFKTKTQLTRSMSDSGNVCVNNSTNNGVAYSCGS